MAILIRYAILLFILFILAGIYKYAIAGWEVPEGGGELYSFQTGKPIGYPLKARERCTGSVCTAQKCTDNQFPGLVWVFIRPQYNNKYAAACIENNPPPPIVVKMLTQTYPTYNIPLEAESIVSYVTYDGITERRVFPLDGCIKYVVPESANYMVYAAWMDAKGKEGAKSDPVVAVTGVPQC